MRFDYEVIEETYKSSRDSRVQEIRERFKDDVAGAEREIILDDAFGKVCLTRLKGLFEKIGGYTFTGKTVLPRTSRELGSLLAAMQCAESNTRMDN